jgi:hypothetical protein
MAIYHMISVQLLRCTGVIPESPIPYPEYQTYRPGLIDGLRMAGAVRNLEYAAVHSSDHQKVTPMGICDETGKLGLRRFKGLH